MRKIAIYGAGGLGKEVLTIIKSINEVNPEFDFIGFFDDHKKHGVIGDFNDINKLDQETDMVVAVGDPKLKHHLIDKIQNTKISFATLIHPTAVLGDKNKVKIGDGTIICAGAVLTTDINLEHHVLINLNCTVGHDVHIGNYTSVMPGVNIAGNVNIGKKTFIGSGANIINNLKVGEGATVGAGAVVITNVEPGTTVVGIPAKPLKTEL